MRLSVLSVLCLCTWCFLAGCLAQPSHHSQNGSQAVVLTPASTSRPVPTVPTFTPTATPSATPSATPTYTFAVSTPMPSRTEAGRYDNLEEHLDGQYELQRSGARVVARFTTSRSPVQYWARGVPQLLFTLPEPFRPPYSVLRTATGIPVLADGTPDPTRTETVRFLMRLDPDGSVHYVDDGHVEAIGYLAYFLDTVWGITPAANDRAILEILDHHWFGKTLLSAEPPPVQVECDPSGSAIWWTLPATRVGALVTFDADGRTTALRAHSDNLCKSVNPKYHFKSPLLAELGQLHRLEQLDLGFRERYFKPSGPTRRMAMDREGRIPAKTGGALTGVIPPQLGQLSHLHYLDLQGQLLTGPLPPELGRLVSLTHLDLGYNLLTGSLPPEWGQLASLESLNLGGNRLTGPLPPELGHLASLKHLDLGWNVHIGDVNGNQLTALPPEVGQLTQLQTLDLIGIELTSLPPEVGQLTNLQTLDLEVNQLTALPPEVGQLANLESLNLSHNQLTTLPPELGQLPRLQTLILRFNQLTALPPELGQLAQLQTLDLYGNQLTALPPEAGQLASLESLNLSHNQLTTLPPELGQLASLESLNVSNNRLTGCAPGTFQRIPHLATDLPPCAD